MTFQARCPLAGGAELLRTEIGGCSPASKLAEQVRLLAGRAEFLRTMIGGCSPSFKLARRVELLRIKITLGKMEIFDRNVF